MTVPPRPRRWSSVRAILLLTLALALAAAVPASAVVPPTSCGTSKIGRTNYSIKADKVSCTFAREWSRNYLLRNRRPSGYTCRKYDPRETRIRFRCYRGTKSFFAIRR